MRRLAPYKDYFWAFYDEHKIVVLLHGFQKKTQKIQRKEINRAKQLRNNYYEDKNNK